MSWVSTDEEIENPFFLSLTIVMVAKTRVIQVSTPLQFLILLTCTTSKVINFNSHEIVSNR